MQEANTFRMMMFIGAVLVISVLIGLVTANYDGLVNLFENFFSFKLQKY